MIYRNIIRWTYALLLDGFLANSAKRTRLGVAMCIVGSGRAHLFSPTVLAVLACDWSEDWASFKLLQVGEADFQRGPTVSWLA